MNPHLRTENMFGFTKIQVNSSLVLMATLMKIRNEFAYYNREKLAGHNVKSTGRPRFSPPLSTLKSLFSSNNRNKRLFDSTPGATTYLLQHK